ncbi:ABC transporter substrate-binding protein [Pseudonocardia xishanensis]|uniref:SsuA/THI5-like domain-containing protein n=1 Tax=Pseudonocardia xishanensis TaxID=630995 RepID=A0ABP8RUW5_9PSEU
MGWGLASAVLAMSLAACGGSSSSAGPDSGSISFGNIPQAASAMLFAQADQDGLWAKHDVKVQVNQAPSLAVLYQEFSSGQHDCIFGDPGGFAIQASQGVPVTVISSMSPNFAYLVSGATTRNTDPSSLVGKRLVTQAASGTFKFFSAVAKEWYGVDMATGVQVVNAQDGAQAMAQVSAGSADAAYVLESAPTTALQSNPALAITYNPADDFAARTGKTAWQTVLMCRTDKGLNGAAVGRLVEVFQDAARAALSDPAKADRLAVEVTGSKPGVYKTIFESGRLKYDLIPINDKVASDLQTAIDLQQRAGTLQKAEIPSSFYAGAVALQQ